MRAWRNAGVTLAILLFARAAIGQETSTPAPASPPTSSPQTQRALATHEFLGLGAVPDKVAAARGAPLFQQNCSFCHGPEGRGAEGPSLITSDVVLGDDHGEHLVPFLKAGRPEKGMPSFAKVPDNELKDIAEYLHLQVEDVANRGTYKILNIVTGDPVKGRAYVQTNCMSCHNDATFAHIRSKFRAPELLQRGWIWPARPSDHSLDVTAIVRLPGGRVVSGRVTMISDFKIGLLGGDGSPQILDRGPDVVVDLKDPLAAHEALIATLKNDDMRNVTAYLDTRK